MKMQVVKSAYFAFILFTFATTVCTGRVYSEMNDIQQDINIINAIMNSNSGGKSYKIDIVRNPNCSCVLVVFEDGEENQALDITKNMGEAIHIYEGEENRVYLEYSRQFKEKLSQAGDIVFFNNTDESLPKETLEAIKLFSSQNNSGIAVEFRFSGDKVQGQKVAESFRHILKRCSNYSVSGMT